MRADSLTQKNASHFWCPSGTFADFVSNIVTDVPVSLWDIHGGDACLK